jgi:hypothetical protein
MADWVRPIGGISCGGHGTVLEADGNMGTMLVST